MARKLLSRMILFAKYECFCNHRTMSCFAARLPSESAHALHRWCRATASCQTDAVRMPTSSCLWAMMHKREMNSVCKMLCRLAFVWSASSGFGVIATIYRASELSKPSITGGVVNGRYSILFQPYSSRFAAKPDSCSRSSGFLTSRSQWSEKGSETIRRPVSQLLMREETQASASSTPGAEVVYTTGSHS